MKRESYRTRESNVSRDECAVEESLRKYTSKTEFIVVGGSEKESNGTK